MLQKYRWLGKKQIILILVLAAGLGGVSVFRSFADTPDASKAHVDFSEFHPNTDLNTTHYLSNNYVSGQSEWAVLWFDGVDTQGKYRMYNSDPAAAEAMCHWDEFRWTDTGLSYNRTVRDAQDLCGGLEQSHTVTYTPGIVYLPRLWNGKGWVKQGRSVATFEEGGVKKCHGVIEWKSELFEKPVELDKGLTATHMRNTQQTSWTHGEGSETGCKPGAKTEYEENLYFVTDLQIQGDKAVAKGLKRSVGGSVDRLREGQNWDWDIWFHEWRPLPGTQKKAVNQTLPAARPDTFTRQSDGLTGSNVQSVARIQDTVRYAGKRPYTVIRLDKNARQAGGSVKFADAAELAQYIAKESQFGAKKFRLCISARVASDTALARLSLFGKATAVSIRASDAYTSYCSDSVTVPKAYTDKLAPWVDTSGADLLIDSMSLEQST